MSRSSWQMGTSTVHTTARPNTNVDMLYFLNEGLEGVEHQRYDNPHNFIQVIDKHTSDFLLGNLSQYLVFSPVTQGQLADIERVRTQQKKGLRFMYLNDKETLIVKNLSMGGPMQEFSGMSLRIFHDMQLMAELSGGLFYMGGKKFLCAGSSMEVETAFRPPNSSHTTCWPTYVIEYGYSQFLTRLRADAHWWLENSGGEVNYVMVISIAEQEKMIHFEMWELIKSPNTKVTQADPNPSRIRPTMTNEAKIIGSAVTGAPWTLDFQKVMLREPRGAEGDFVFTAEDFMHYGGSLRSIGL